jgi:hypothetical protein
MNIAREQWAKNWDRTFDEEKEIPLASGEALNDGPSADTEASSENLGGS